MGLLLTIGSDDPPLFCTNLARIRTGWHPSSAMHLQTSRVARNSFLASAAPPALADRLLPASTIGGRSMEQIPAQLSRRATLRLICGGARPVSNCANAPSVGGRRLALVRAIPGRALLLFTAPASERISCCGVRCPRDKHHLSLRASASPPPYSSIVWSAVMGRQPCCPSAAVPATDPAFPGSRPEY